MRAALFTPADRSGYRQLKVPIANIKATIFGHAEFTTFNNWVTALLENWRKTNALRLKGIAIGDKPKALIETLSEGLLEIFEKAPLVEPYDVYQHLMNYWTETMQDDVYMIVSGGWQEAVKPRLIAEDKEKKNKEKADFTAGKLKYKADLVDPASIVARYSSAERAAIEKLDAEVASIEQNIEELQDEHGGEEGLLAEVIDQGRFPKPP